MAFALKIKDSLLARECQVPIELANGDPLGVVLTRDLLAVEAAADTDMLTSILLLDGNQLRHGAAPHLPEAYCSAVDGAEIGPSAGSCGTAAYFGHPVHVTDISSDPLWADYRELALAHGLRASWSTPIFDDQLAVIGTFAIYHLTPRAPTPEEMEAIQAITGHVARAIMWSRDRQEMVEQGARVAPAPQPLLKLVTSDYSPPKSRLEPKLPGNIHELPITATDAGAFEPDWRANIATQFEAISDAIDVAIDRLAACAPASLEIGPLERAKKASQNGAALARRALPPNGNET